MTIINKMFDELKTEAGREKPRDVRSYKYEPDSENPEEREQALLEGVHRIYYDERTHDFKISNGEILIFPKGENADFLSGQMLKIVPARELPKNADWSFGDNLCGWKPEVEIKLVNVTVNPDSRVEITNKETLRKEFVSLYNQAKKNREI